MKKKEQKAFTAGQAASIAGVAYHQLNHWAMQGVVTPSIEDGRGYGGVRAYSLADIVALKLVSRMKENGFALRQLQGLVAKIQEWDDSSSKTMFVCAEDGSVAAHDEREALTALKSKDRKAITWLVSIKDLVEEVRTQAASIVRPLRGKAVRIA